MSHSRNILFILTDQWPAWAFSHRGAGIATPNIDRLAQRATDFTNAFTTCPLCTPARGTLLTARWPHQTGIYDNSAVGYSTQTSLSLDESTWIDGAVRRGFHTGYFGKWHLGRINPERRGVHAFDPNVEIHAKPYDAATNPYSYDHMAERYRQQSRELLTRGRAPFWGNTTRPKARVQPFPVMDAGVGFLQDWAEGRRDRPFFLTVSAQPPHFPHYLPRTYVEIAQALREHVNLPASIEDSFDGKPWFHASPWWPCMDTSVLDSEEWKTVIAYSHAHITMVDEAIGRVLGALDQLGLRDSTTVVFTADHGDMEGAHNRFDKGPYFYEEVWRIPLLIARPGAPACLQEAFCSIIDVGATLFDLIGCPPEPGKPHGGRSLLPLVGTPAAPDHWPRRAYGIYDRYNGMSFAVRAIRDERWKFIWNPQDIDELYDLETDPHEMVNLAGRETSGNVQDRLQRELAAWLEAIADPLPTTADRLPAAGTILATGKAGP